MNLLEFAEALRKLLLRTHSAGFDADEIGATADSVLESAWDQPITQDMLPDISDPE